MRYGCIVPMVVVMVGLPALILATTDEPRLETARAIAPLLVGAGVMFGVLASSGWRRRRTFNKLIREASGANRFGRYELVIDDRAASESGPAGDTIRKWASVEQVVTTPGHVFIVMAGREAFVIPGHAFPGDEERDGFVRRAAELAGVEVTTAGS